MLTCKHATELMSQELDRKLSWRERMALRLHLMMCNGCHRYRKQMEFLRRAMRRYGGGDPGGG